MHCKWNLHVGNHVLPLGSLEHERTPIGHMFVVLDCRANNERVPKIRPMLQDEVWECEIWYAISSVPT